MPPKKQLVSELPSPWGKIAVSNKPVLFCAGDLHLWFWTENGDLVLSSETRKENCTGLDPEAKHQRWAFARNIKEIRLVPVLPDRPLVAFSIDPIIIPPGGKSDFFANIPLRMEIEFPNLENLTPIELPLQILSNTWFGSPIEGQLCYSFPEGATRCAQSFPDPAKYAICCFSITNEDRSDFIFKRICLQTEHMRMLTNNIGTEKSEPPEFLASSQVQVVFRGVDQVSRISFEHSHSIKDKKFSNIVRLERVESNASALRRSFQQFSGQYQGMVK